MFVLVAPVKSSFDQLGITYKVPSQLEWVELGSFVEVPLKGKAELAIVFKIFDTLEEWLSKMEIREVIWVRSPLQMWEIQRTLIQWLAQHYFVLISTACALFIPKNLQEKIKKNTLKPLKTIPKISPLSSIQLSLQQKKILDQLQSTQNKKILFWGIMGSGKTEIYIEIARKNLIEGKQTLILIPEIILSNQIAQRFRQIFWDDIPVINSSLSEAKKTQTWVSIYENLYPIILGTRSALFYPYKNLATIIIDEEHDSSYTSDSGPRYNAREVAEKLSELTWAKLILASGTPSVKSMYRATQKKYALVTLLEKFDKTA